MQFGTKAETLHSLSKIYPELNIPNVFILIVEQWKQDSDAVLDDIRQYFRGQTKSLAVRSSSEGEDGEKSSNAGAFKSVLQVPLHDNEQLYEAVEAVIASYPNSQGQVLVQPTVANIAVSGVILTRTLNSGAPYYVINYDDESGRTDTVTGGKGPSKTIYVYKGGHDADFDSPRVLAMLNLARTLEAIFKNDSLDIEFGLDKAGKLHLFQVRRICREKFWSKDSQAPVVDNIQFVEQFVRQCMAPRPSLFGSRTMLGVMPDWNPAEIIGITPHLLACSLYRELITKRTWSRARENMGYRDMPAEELMVMVAGRPYIDIRASFNSFLPKGLPDPTCVTLVDSWMDRLDKHPELHDKVEFEVVPTVYDFDFESRFVKRYPGVLTSGELDHFAQQLQILTQRNLDLGKGGTLAWAEAEIAGLHATQMARPSDLHSYRDFTILPFTRSLMEECRERGTLPFSILARHGFIAETLLRSAVRLKAITAGRVAAFKRSVRTIAGEFTDDFRHAIAGELDREVFLQRYGHLRPGTYDILSPRYADRQGLFAGSFPEAEAQVAEFVLSQNERRDIDALLDRAGLSGLGADGFLEYFCRAIQGREYGKFVFSRHLSDILECFAVWGGQEGLDRETVSHLDASDILNQLVCSVHNDCAAHYLQLAERGKHLLRLASSLKLSYLIRSPRDVYIVPMHRSAPNFIASGKLECPLIVLDAASDCKLDIAGKIVCIENADPGFDWIFSRGIAGLVTKYGGANSHMAIRCAEYGVPAVIGCGEMLYRKVVAASSVVLDADSHILKPL